MPQELRPEIHKGRARAATGLKGFKDFAVKGGRAATGLKGFNGREGS